MAITDNNYHRLREEANIAMVVDHLQIPVTRRGSNFFILCPLPEHNDTRPTNCYFKDGWNKLYCWACGKSINAINLIMLTKGCSYGEAADTLWNIEGCPDWYYANRNSKKKTFSLAKEQAELIGLQLTGRILFPKKYTDVKEELRKGEEYITKDIDGYLKCTSAYVHYQDFLSEPDFIELCIKKCKEKIGTLEKSVKYLECVVQALTLHGIHNTDTNAILLIKKEEQKSCKQLFYKLVNAKKKLVTV